MSVSLLFLITSPCFFFFLSFITIRNYLYVYFSSPLDFKFYHAWLIPGAHSLRTSWRNVWINKRLRTSPGLPRTSGFSHILPHPIVCLKDVVLLKLEGFPSPRWLHFKGVFSQLMSFFEILLKAKCDSHLGHSPHRRAHRSRLEAPSKTFCSCQSRSQATTCHLRKRDRSPGSSGLMLVNYSSQSTTLESLKARIKVGCEHRKSK